jgi:glycerophosphoryl diester phosphodiesterase
MTNTAGLPLIGAHRGATASAPENTMAAFAAAVALHADFIETDIRRTADGVLVLHHDPEIGTLKVSAATVATLRIAAPSLATLEDLLQLAKGKIGLDLELKEAGYEPQVAAMLRDRQFATDAYVITSFLESAVRRFKEGCREAKCGLLVEDQSWENELSPETRLRDAGADFVAAEDSLVTPGFVRRVAAKHFPVWVWTVNDPRRIAALLATPGVEAIVTDALELAQNEQARTRAPAAPTGGLRHLIL